MTKLTKEKIKDCPHCGATSQNVSLPMLRGVTVYKEGDKEGVICLECGAGAITVDSWNMRVTPCVPKPTPKPKLVCGLPPSAPDLEAIIHVLKNNNGAMPIAIFLSRVGRKMKTARVKELVRSSPHLSYQTVPGKGKRTRKVICYSEIPVPPSPTKDKVTVQETVIKQVAPDPFSGVVVPVMESDAAPLPTNGRLIPKVQAPVATKSHRPNGAIMWEKNKETDDGKPILEVYPKNKHLKRRAELSKVLRKFGLQLTLQEIAERTKLGFLSSAILGYVSTLAKSIDDKQVAYWVNQFVTQPYSMSHIVSTLNKLVENEWLQRPSDYKVASTEKLQTMVNAPF